jgi:hypothetical protein
MGHIRLGRLPKRKTWNQVCDLLSSSSDAKNIANSLSKAAKNGLLQEENQRGLFHTLRYLINLVNASTTDAFDKALSDIDIQVSPQESGMASLGHILEKIRSTVQEAEGSSCLDSIAATAFQETLTKTVQENAQTLFGCSVDDVKIAFRQYSTKTKFGEIARLFFSAYLTRTFQSLIDRAISEYIGKGRNFKEAGDVLEFQNALKTYCWDVSKIVEDFSGGWYSKHQWEGTLTDDEIKRFSSYSLKKILSEIGRQ